MLQLLFKYRKYYTHIFFWFGFFVVFVFFWSGRLAFTEALVKSLLITSIEVTIAYLNLLVLVPLYFMKKKYLMYVLFSVSIFSCSVMLLNFASPVPSDENFFPRKQRWGHENRILQDSLINNQERNIRRERMRQNLGREHKPPRPEFMMRLARQARNLFNGMLTIGVILMSTAIGVSQYAFKKEQEATLYKSEKIEAEMKFLKSQINPHFLFNALNSAYTLAYIKADEAPDVILRISDMLRYLIYECEADKVPVEKEITYIKNYIAIQKMRLEQPENITVNWQVENNQLMVAPMLFIPFIENSFKHSHIENTEKGYIDINFNMNRKGIDFSIKNSLPLQDYSKDKVGGIGLENVKRRLELIYPENYELNISQTPSDFYVNLNLKIS